ncbi:hypothetical protein ACE3MQ_25145 [Paenibacillus lentus]|uniref:hypothetical protein n=1 Tax=Paenibacillus lentus TaxID=1338368 RepID=UPI0036502D0D
MGIYFIEVPVVMKLMINLEAESEEEAREKLFSGDLNIEVKDSGDQLEILDWEWDMYDQVVQGNVYYGSINKLEITKED